jgi:hypothetical protein
LTGIRIQPNPHIYEDAQAFEDYKAGANTLRQYKERTNQVITDADESNPAIDKHIIQAGAGAVLLEDVGVNPDVDYAMDVQDEEKDAKKV